MLAKGKGVRGSAKGFNLKVFYEQVGNEETHGRTHGCTMDLFIILTLEEKVSVFKTKLRKVTICWIDIWVLCGSVGSCESFCCTMLIEGSTGTEVKRALTS